MQRIDTRVRSGAPLFGVGARAMLVAAFAAGALLANGGSSDVAAQAPEADTIPQYNLDSLVVTVLRTPVRVGNSPYPVAVAGEAELRRGKTGLFLDEALENLPGVQVQNRYNYAVGERVSIRGFGSRSQFGIRGIHVVVDGIPATLPDGQSTIDHLDIASLGRVEALRGPASALYGNASGGVLRFETEVPSTSPIRQEVTTMGGSDGMLRLQSLTTGTAGGTGYLLSVDQLSYDGFRQTDTGDDYGTADRLHVNGRAEHALGGGQLGVTFNYLDLDAENAGSLDRDSFNEDSEQILGLYLSNGTGKEVQQGQLGLTWAGPVGGFHTDAMVYGITRDFENPIPFNYIDVDRRAFGARFSLGSPEEPAGEAIQWRGGIEVDYQDDDRREYGNDGGEPDVGDPGLDQGETVRSTGVFGQITLPLTERVDLLGGIRYDHFRFEVDDRLDASIDPVDDSGERTMDAVSPTVGVHVEATPWLGIFGNYSTFFETPTTVELGNRESGAGGFNPDLDPQSGWTVELGGRGTIQERLSYELTVFTSELEDELISYEIPSAPGENFYRNAGSSSRLGFEAVLQARLHERVTGQLSYAYTDAEFDDYEVDGDDYSGNQVPGFAPQELQANLRYDPGSWYLDVGANHVDEVPVNDANEFAGERALAFTDAYTLFDVRVGAESVPIGRVEISPFAGVRNLTDELYSASVAVNAFGGRFFEPGPGRTFYVGGTLAVSR